MIWASKKSAAAMAISSFRIVSDRRIWVQKATRPTPWRPNLPPKDPKQIADLSFYMTASFCSLELEQEQVAKSILRKYQRVLYIPKLGISSSQFYSIPSSSVTTQLWTSKPLCDDDVQVHLRHDDKCLKVLKEHWKELLL